MLTEAFQTRRVSDQEVRTFLWTIERIERGFRRRQTPRRLLCHSFSFHEMPFESAKQRKTVLRVQRNKWHEMLQDFVAKAIHSNGRKSAMYRKA